MHSDIADQIAQLPDLSRKQLLALWHESYGKPAPHRLRRELLVPFLAYRIQENVHGGLKPTVRSELRRIVRGVETKDSASVVRPGIKTGTRLHREWHGQTYEVAVTQDGFEYLGTNYRSLSGIARKITGTRWSGPAFFGLPESRKKANND